jgi:ATP-dependent Lon protease
MKTRKELPFINVRDFVMFPKMTQGLFIGRKPTIDAIMYALTKSHKKLLVLSQKEVQNVQPKSLREMYSLGTVCSVEGSVLLRDGTMKAVLSGESMFQVSRLFEKENVQFAQGTLLNESAKTDSIDHSLKIGLLELLLRVKPYAALDEDATWFDKLKKENDIRHFLELLQMNLNYRGSFKKDTSKKRNSFINSRVRLHQQLLLESRLDKKLGLVEKCFQFELENIAFTRNFDSRK